MAVYGTIAYGVNLKTAGLDLNAVDSYTDATNSLALHGSEIAAGWTVTAAVKSGYAGPPITVNFTNTTVQTVDLSQSGKIYITLVGSFNADDLNNADNIMYCFTAPGGVTCFVAGTRVLTVNGYKAVESLTSVDKILTSDRRAVASKVYSFEIHCATEDTAPYRIEAGAFGRNLPAAPIALSPIHKIQVRPHLWTSPLAASYNGNTHVKQYGIGEPIRYYHIECENYLRDNIVTEGLVVESLGNKQNYKSKVYTWNARLKGYTRISPDTEAVSRVC